MSFGLTKDGVKIKKYPDLIESMENKAKQLYGEDVNLSERSPLGLFLKNIAWELKDLWQLGQDVYYSAYVDFAEGFSLDNTGKIITIERKPAQKANGTITIFGESKTNIPKGFKISTDMVVFETTISSVIGDNGKIEIPIVAIEPGENGNVPANTITKIVNPIPGVDSITNLEQTQGGREIEEDYEFRERYYRSLSKGGSSTREAVEAALLDMSNVVDAFVDENETNEYINDIPPHSLAPYVFGGNDEDIAKTILKAKAGGIRSYGLTEERIKDNKGVEHTIGFTRPSVKNIYVKLNIVKDSFYPGDDVVTRAVLNYVGGEDKDGVSYKGLKLGEKVVISKIMANVMCLKGTSDIEVEISLDGETYQPTNIEIEKNEIAKTDYNKVVINYVE